MKWHVKNQRTQTSESDMSSAAGKYVGKASGGSTKPPESDVAALKRLLERTPNVR